MVHGIDTEIRRPFSEEREYTRRHCPVLKQTGQTAAVRLRTTHELSSDIYLHKVGFENLFKTRPWNHIIHTIGTPCALLLVWWRLGVDVVEQALREVSCPHNERRKCT